MIGVLEPSGAYANAVVAGSVLHEPSYTAFQTASTLWLAGTIYATALDYCMHAK